MLSENSYLKLVRASAWYDLVVTAAFATPWSLAVFVGWLNALHVALGLGGEAVTATPYTVLFGNFFGSVVVVWSVFRIRHATVRLGRYDAAGRVAFSLWQVNALLAGASPLLVLFLAAELGLGAAQLLPVRALAQEREI